MKENKNRIFVAILALCIVIGGIFFINSNRGNNFDKVIDVKIMDSEGKVVLDESLGTNGATLADALKEWKENGDIQLEFENSEYGMFITGMGNEKLLEQNEKEGLYWMYNSENNKACVADGFCSAADSLEIADEDAFVFTLSKME